MVSDMNDGHAVVSWALDDLPNIGIVEYVYTMLDIGNPISTLTATSATVVDQHIGFLSCNDHR